MNVCHFVCTLISVPRWSTRFKYRLASKSCTFRGQSMQCIYTGTECNITYDEFGDQGCWLLSMHRHLLIFPFIEWRCCMMCVSISESLNKRSISTEVSTPFPFSLHLYIILHLLAKKIVITIHSFTVELISQL